MEPRHRDDPQRLTPTPTGSATARCLVIGPYLRHPEVRAGSARADADMRAPDARLAEATGLARAIDLDVVESGIVLLSAIRPATYLGKGKVEEFAGLVKSLEIGLVVMDCALSPVQQRNLERAWSAKVLDRTGLILEIFGRRAATREGTLQVELAHLTYQKSRLVRSWTHLERQRGGFGFLGGPGETQIETDRRLIQDRIRRIEHDLEGVKRTRALHRTSRKRVPYPIVALVGYTNAGKSTLFNRLTRSGVLAADMLFATLDPTLRAVDLPDGPRVILSDTVGFISDLPTMLVAAFRATLEEVIEADLILHVRDVSHGDTSAQSKDVDQVLEELGIPPEDERILEVWNKIDQVSPEERERLENLAARQPAERRPRLVSAISGEGLDALVATISERVARTRVALTVEVDAADGAALSWLHRTGDVLDSTTSEDGVTTVHLRVHPSREGQVRAKFGERVQAG
ncbi:MULTISPECIES: GTPase HflX [Rhodoplanes]|uniref:GTPase HflX n=1 Tax=Rhodoplanes TaxID=29407 RepID=UPI00352083B1